MDPAEYPAPGAPPTTGTGSSGEENKENHDDDATRTPNSRKKGRGTVYSCKIVIRFGVRILGDTWRNHSMAVWMRRLEHFRLHLTHSPYITLHRLSRVIFFYVETIFVSILYLVL